MRFRHRLAAGTALGLITAVGVSVTHDVAVAQEATPPPPPTTLGGFQGTAASSGIYVTYNPEGLLPVGPIIGVGAPDALATVTSGPTTFARAATVDPGDIVANPDAVLTLADPNYPQGTLPPYPYRVAATSGFGEPTAESSPAPGLHARVEATPEGSTARATMPRADAPAIATFGSVSSLATTRTDGSTVTAHIRTEVSRFALLDVLDIDSIVTDLTVTSDGGEPKLEGGTTVTGATLMGNPVTIDANGIQGDGGTDAVNDILVNAGIRVTVAGPVRQAGATAGQLASTGLRIDLDLSERTIPALSALAALEALPPLELAPGAPTMADLVVAVRARHVGSIELARGVVSLTASGGFDDGVLDDFVDPLTPDAGLGDLGGVFDALAPTPVGSLASPAADRGSRGTTAPVATAAARVPNIPLGSGVGALVLLGFLVEPFIGGRLARLAGTVLGGDTVACPREER